MAHRPLKSTAHLEAAPSRARRSVAVGGAVLSLFLVVAHNGFAGDVKSSRDAADKSFSREAIEFFESRVRPILADRCLKCHGPEKQSSSLRLDSREAIVKGGESGPSIVPAKPDESLLIKAVSHTGEELKMPPGGKLPEPALAVLRQWVAMGAPWSPDSSKATPAARAAKSGSTNASEPHWAFQPVKRLALPAVKNRDWIKTPVDAFVLAGLERAGISPSPAADRRTLIRRATIDLWGIPPTAEEVDAFLADDTPVAFVRLVDRLLASPRYGERWGRHWLDVARYADTKGYVFTQDRRYPYAYTYRDYVIAAFNADLGYDQFIVEQLAADQLAKGANTPAAGRDGVLDGRPAVPARSERDHRRPDRRGLSGALGLDRHLCALPRPQVRPDSDGRLLLALRRLRQLGRAGRAADLEPAGSRTQLAADYERKLAAATKKRDDYLAACRDEVGR